MVCVVFNNLQNCYFSITSNFHLIQFMCSVFSYYFHPHYCNII